MNEHNGGEGSYCVIRRSGLVTEADDDGVTAEIEGKSLRIARAKVEAGVSPGDVIIWNGKIWTASHSGV